MLSLPRGALGGRVQLVLGRSRWLGLAAHILLEFVLCLQRVSRIVAELKPESKAVELLRS